MNEKKPANKDLLNKHMRSLASIDDNIYEWSQLTNCNERFDACTNAIKFVVTDGNFLAGGTKTLSQALQIDASHNLQGAFLIEVLVGILCQESSFGTNIPIRPNIKGPFQLGASALTDYNARNPDNPIIYPDEMDDYSDLPQAAKAAAWYYATHLQQLTFSTPYLNPVYDNIEAKKFAVAAYNGGSGLIRSAREITDDTNGGKSKWDIVKTNLENAGVTHDKAVEIIAYVDNVLAYASKSTTCWCVNC